MRRNVITFLKFLLLATFTIMCTVLVFRYIRPPRYPLKENEKEVIVREGKEPAKPGIPLVQYDFEEDNEKIDWHDKVYIEADKNRKGIGEQGIAAHLSPNESDIREALYKVNGFNAALSDKISLDRAVPDIRHPNCARKKYLKRLPTVSVIVPFHNEHWTTLLRTAHSVVNRSPPELLAEIILVDDCSTKDFSKKQLDDYVKEKMKKVKVIHLPDRQGLIRARLAGARIAKGEVLLFLDSHTEANVNWLPPLLEPIALDYKTCVCPFIDVICFETFNYRAQDEGARGAFDWEFFYKRLPLLPEDLKHPTEPFKSPIMAGGLFAISSKFFWELGGYDEGLDIWGGEQYELSFKIWQCGGQMYDAPCSRVGHIYRKFAPFPNDRKHDFVGKNYRRVAEVWMDEYAQYLYNRRPHYKDIDPGDITKQRELRNKLQCKPFKWFIENIAFDLVRKYPPIEPPDYAKGEIRSIATPEFCIDAEHKGQEVPFGLQECTRVGKPDQNFTLTWHKDIRPKGRQLCWDVSSAADHAPVSLFPCHMAGGNQYWKYDVNNQWLIHGGNPRCLDADPSSKKIYVTKCDQNAVTQKWRFEIVDLEVIKNWDDTLP